MTDAATIPTGTEPEQSTGSTVERKGAAAAAHGSRSNQLTSSSRSTTAVAAWRGHHPPHPRLGSHPPESAVFVMGWPATWACHTLQGRPTKGHPAARGMQSAGYANPRRTDLGELACTRPPFDDPVQLVEGVSMQVLQREKK